MRAMSLGSCSRGNTDLGGQQPILGRLLVEVAKLGVADVGHKKRDGG